MDVNFPVIEYATDTDHRENGRSHGEAYREAIHELFHIRKDLMLGRNPGLEPELEPLAKAQFEVSRKFDPDLAEELEGIAEGANLSLSDIVIVNNYTDFRDINLPEEGCSTIHIESEKGIFSGQTWDMHASAKKYVCLIKSPSMVSFSLVGCVGMMGFNTDRAMIGVNNINTKNARAGLIWPLLVRHVLKAKNLKGMQERLIKSPVTSGHSYILSHPDGGEIWEVTPDLSRQTGNLPKGSKGHIFHTNHCLDKDVIEQEVKTGINSTTHIRYEILERRLKEVKDFDGLFQMFQDHENYPKSICSHFESGAQDPSFTCGGGVGDFQSGKVSFWRGCPEHDTNYVQHDFQISSEGIVKL